MLFDVQLEPVREDGLVGFQRGELAQVVAPYLHIAAEDRPGRTRLKRGFGGLKPFRMGAAVRIYEGENIAKRGLHPGISCLSGTRLLFVQQTNAGASRNDRVGKLSRAVVHDDDFECIPPNGLRLEGRQTGVEKVRLVQMGNDHGNTRRCGGHVNIPNVCERPGGPAMSFGSGSWARPRRRGRSNQNLCDGVMCEHMVSATECFAFSSHLDTAPHRDSGKGNQHLFRLPPQELYNIHGLGLTGNSMFEIGAICLAYPCVIS